MPYGQWWRRHRRAFWQHFNPTAAPQHKHIAILRATTHKFLYTLIVDTTHFIKHIR